ncbi:hypothetical protein ACFV9D_24535 [Streptomyces sp. NPDC059875]|uniref:hypothetical protein n=1 Tax=unclassified Streptomyces TaxID=2593676 RepID=UPI00364E8FE6
MTASWTVTPSATSVDVRDGQSVAVSFAVTNTTTAPEQRRGTLIMQPDPSTGAAVSWFTIDRDTRVFTPGSTEAFAVTVAPPAGTDPGEHRFSGFVFETDHPAVATSAESSPVTLDLIETPWTISAAATKIVLFLGFFEVDFSFDITGPVGRSVTVRIRQRGGSQVDTAWFRVHRLPHTIGDSGSAQVPVTVGPPDPKGSRPVPKADFFADLFEVTGATSKLRASFGPMHLTVRSLFPPQDFAV